MHRMLNIHTKKTYIDVEIVLGLQSRNRDIERWFYNTSKQYFMSHFGEVFFDKDQKDAIFQDAFLCLWTQIENGVISIQDNIVCRQQRNGQLQPMTCSLHTFLFSIARNKYREVVRSTREIYIEEYFEGISSDILYNQGDDDDKEIKIRIVDECIQMMPPRCLEILTLFYIEGKTLDEIMQIRKDKNSSKVGLKSAKYKCMNSLREKITEMCNRFNLTI